MVVGTERDVTLVPGDAACRRRSSCTRSEVAGVVRWNDGLADRPLDDLMAALADYEGDRVPVILAGPGVRRRPGRRPTAT